MSEFLLQIIDSLTLARPSECEASLKNETTHYLEILYI